MKKDYIGQKFGKLTICEECEPVIYKGKNGYNIISHRVLCECECGNFKVLNLSNVVAGYTKSCGCLYKTSKGAFKQKYNTYEINGEITKIYDDKGNFSIIDTEDLEKIKPYYFTLNCNGYFRNSAKKIFLHRLITDCPKGLVVDHINHNVLDNRKCNLRVCSQADNMKNTKSIGVSFRKDTKKYQAYIHQNNKKISLGYYVTFEEALKVRKEAEKKYFGDFAYKEE